MKMAWEQIKQLIPNVDQCSADDRALIERTLRVAWADNGDSLSIQYAGTCAMRSDTTRTGKATIKGHMNDAIGAITRYYINNFEDGRNQDAIDIINARRPVTQDFKIDASNYRKLDPIRTFLMAVFTFIFKATKPSRQSTVGLFLCFIWMALVWIIWKIFFLDPNRIIDIPRLKPHSRKSHSVPQPTPPKN